MNYCLTNYIKFNLHFKRILFSIFFLIISLEQYGQDQNRYKDVIEQLFIVDNDDQKYRIEIEYLEMRYGIHSQQVDSLWSLMRLTDSLNLIKVEAILDKYGWLSETEIGSQCNTVLFMVIQHSDLKTQEYYLPLMRDAVRCKKAKAAELALLEDRVAIRNSKEQIYGSQIGQDPTTLKYFVLPLIDPENVDKRRAEVGFQAIAHYLEYWNLTWDVDQHKKDKHKTQTEKVTQISFL